MIGVFTLQWATPIGLKSMKGNGTPFYTVEHLQKVIDEAFKAGREQGDSEGRVELRRMVEAGEIPPIVKDTYA